MKTDKTLQINKPLGKTVVLGLLILAVTLTAMEFLARVPVVQSMLPAPSIGSAHKKLDLNFSFLDRLTEEDGPVDFLFIGSSMVKASIDPEILSASYLRESGKSIRCFNFGVAGFTAGATANMADILVRKYKPTVLLWGISPESFIQGAGQKARQQLEINPWYKYQKGDFSISGWLTEHSTAFKYFLRFKIWLENPTLSRELALREDGMSRYGFSRKNREGKLQADNNLDRNRLKAFLKSKTLNLSQQALSTMRKVAALKSEVKVVFVEIPVHGSIETIYDQTPELREEIKEKIIQFAAQEKIELIQTQSLQTIPDSGWKNMNHMNVKGADLFSQWLGKQLAQEKI